MKRTGNIRLQKQLNGQSDEAGRFHSIASGLVENPTWPAVRPVFSAGVWATSLSVLVSTAGAVFAMLPVTEFKHANAMAANGVGTLIPITGSNLKVTYDPGFDADRPSVYCQNHISMLDASVACQVIPRPFCGLMNHWHFRIPGYGWIMKATKGIPVFPRASGRTAEITDAARERVEQGVSILVFPEAHRTLDGTPREFRRGVFFMARDAGVPVVPLAVRGLYDINRKGQLGFTPGEIEVYVGPQVGVEGLDDDAIAEVAARMTAFAQKWVAEGVADSESLLARSAG